MMSASPRSREFTGRHLLALLLLFFGIVIAVNATMAAFASRSWSGFVVRNSYVASQQFNSRAAEARAQAALGWSGRLALAAGRLRYELRDARGVPVRASSMTARFRRPVSDRQDRTAILLPARGEGFATDMVLQDGIWIVEIEAEAGLPHPYREIRRIRIDRGAMR